MTAAPRYGVTRVPQSGTGTRGDDLAEGCLGLVTGGREPVGLCGEAYAMGEDGDGEIVDIVGDAVVRPRRVRELARRVAEAMAPRGEAPRESVAGRGSIG